MKAKREKVKSDLRSRRRGAGGKIILGELGNLEVKKRKREDPKFRINLRRPIRKISK